jgi:diguanylate cyclase (GGDEF)-like protein
MPGLNIARTLQISLKTKVLLLMLGVFVAVSVPAYVSFNWIVNSTVLKLGSLFAEKQVLFDRYRGLETLMREVSLAETLGRSPAIREWSLDETSPEKKARALADLEQYRRSFKDGSVFFIINGSHNYYFADKSSDGPSETPSYTIKRENPRDGWYFKTIAGGAGCQLNVDHDDVLAVTKVWINCVIGDGRNILGVLGTGLDLTNFIQDVVAIPQHGVQGMFVDRSGAIQAHRDPKMVDFHSLTNDTKHKKTIYTLLDKPADRVALGEMFASLKEGKTAVESRFMTVDGKEYLVGIGYLDRLGWFNVTLMDVNEIIDQRLFLPIGALLAAIMIIAVGTLTLLFKRSVLDRLAGLEAAVVRAQDRDFEVKDADQGHDEIGRLSRAFANMANAVGNHTELLESMVRDRTEKLKRLADLDPLTGICNRRGFLDAVADCRKIRAGRHGVLLIDMDLFKTINDAFGHRSGDLVLAEAAKRLKSALGPGDVCGRWGGDEFIILSNCENEIALKTRAGAVLAAISKDSIRLEGGETVRLTISVGGELLGGDEVLDAAVARADLALYAAKSAGRNDVMIYDAARHGDPRAGIQRLA